MKRLLAIVWLTASLAYAQDQSTTNQITSGTNHTWTGVSTGALPAGCCSGGPGALYDPATNIIHFSYGQSTAAQTFAINQALRNAGAGIQVTGYNYSWDINNLNGDNRQGGTDTLTATVLTYNGDNSAIKRTDTWTYNTKFDWTTFSGTVNYANTGPVSDFGNLTVKFTGMDGGYWAGYYGPKVRNVSIGMNYRVDLCAANPLSDPSCPGYAQAYMDQQCAANPLYSTQCSGYAAAYQQQQCSANPLYSPQCPGYATAYHDQQCSINPLFAVDCPGYTQAYHDQQCSINPLYATDCTGYTQAYHDQQCSANALYARDCVGYEQAYLNAQCIRDSLYSPRCEGYKTAYAIKYLVQVDNSASVNQALSNNAAAVAAPPPVATPVEQATTTPSTTSATSPTSVNSVVAPPPPPAGPTSMTTQSPPPPPPAQGAKEEPKPAGPPSTRQALAERRQEAAKQEAVAKGKDLAKNMGAAKSMNDQVAAQGLVAAAMGYRPEFNSYQNAVIPDATAFYKSTQVYGNQKNIDNRTGLRMFGGSELRHQQMVDSQYQIGN